MNLGRARCGYCMQRVELELERCVLALEEKAAEQIGELISICPACSASTVQQVQSPLAAVLAASGMAVIPLHDVSELLQPQPQGLTEVSFPLCPDDVLALHELMKSADWFSALETGEFRVPRSGEEA